MVEKRDFKEKLFVGEPDSVGAIVPDVKNKLAQRPEMASCEILMWIEKYFPDRLLDLSYTGILTGFTWNKLNKALIGMMHSRQCNSVPHAQLGLVISY